MTELLDDLWLRFDAVKKRRVGDVPSGSIVRYKGEWGVKEGRYLDRWIGGPIRLPRDAIVEFLPGVDLKKLLEENK